jgi:HSP20 family protein
VILNNSLKRYYIKRKEINSMLPVKYSPFNSPSLFNRDEFLTPFSTFFDNFFNESFADNFGVDFFEKGTYPKVDVRDEETQIIIEAEVPGLTKEKVNVELDNGILRIKGEKQDVDDKKTKSYVHRELKRSSFCRSFSVGNNIDTNGVDAKFNNGVLEITLKKLKPDPKKEEVKKIEVK